MRIAQVAPLFESCPPKYYGGTERIVSYLTEELVRQGHDVTLFASGDSRTSARLEPCSETALRLDPRIKDPIPYHIVMLDKVRGLADQFDVLHFHIDVLHYPVIRDFSIERSRPCTDVSICRSCRRFTRPFPAPPWFRFRTISENLCPRWTGQARSITGFRAIFCRSTLLPGAVIWRFLDASRPRSGLIVQSRSQRAPAQG